MFELRGLRKSGAGTSGNAGYLGGRKMNYMPEVLKMLNLEVGEKFNIKPLIENPYHFDEDYILVNKNGHNVDDDKIIQILTGAYEVEKLPWKPKEGDFYHCVLHNGTIDFHRWNLKWYDYYCYNSGNCFKTAKEITEEIKQRILQEMKGKYEND